MSLIPSVKSGGKDEIDSKKVFYLSKKDADFLTKNFKKVLVKNGWTDFDSLKESEKILFNNDMNNNDFTGALDLVYGIVGNNLIYTKKAKIKNFIGKVKRCIADKCILAKNINEYSGDTSLKYGKVLSSPLDDDNFIKSHFCKTSFLYDAEKLEFGEGDIKIVKPCGTGFQSGRGIFIVTNKEELEDVKSIYTKERIKKDNLLAESGKTNFKDELLNVSVSEYLKDIMTFTGLKFHLRMYMLITLGPDQCSYKLFDDAKILTAELPYKKSDYTNKEIHDTHEGSTKEFFTFKADWPQLLKAGGIKINAAERDDIFKQCDIMCALLFNIFKKEISIDPKNIIYNKNENKFAFEVFGLDVMIDENCNIFLIEVNDKVEYDYTSGKQDKKNLEKFDKFIYNYYEWVYNWAVRPLSE